MLAADLKGRHPEWSKHKCLQEAELALRREDPDPFFADELLRVAPQLCLPHRTTVSAEVEARAWFEHPATQWLIGESCGAGRGRPAERATLLAGMAQMASSSRPELKQSLLDIADSTLLAWAYRLPAGRAATSAAYETLHAMTRRHGAGMCIHANLTMVRELAGLTTSRGRPVFTDPLRDLAVDGTLIAANVPQHAPKGRSPRKRKAHERQIAGPDRPMAQYVIYAGGKIVSNAVGSGDD